MIYRTPLLRPPRIPSPADALERLPGGGFVLASREGYGPVLRRCLKQEQAEARLFTLPESNLHA
jgi:hypothetical protein